MPAAPLLTTKLYIPRPRDNEVPRPRLRQQLDAVLSRKLGLVCAPPGFGKTTLLTEWLAQCASQIAWVTLDASDNDPIRFWTYLIAALQRVRAEIGESALAMLVGQQPQRLPLESVLTTLINDLAVEPADIVLVLDDYHVIEAASIHDGVSFLLDHLPPRVHMICTTRLDPPLPIGRWRARDQLVELRADDLRFRADEVAAFLNQAMGLSLSADDLTALDERTEGWIAGLQLAALALRGRGDAHDFIAAFTGSHRYIVDYLTGEVLTRQSVDVQNFLLETSILDRFNVALCAAVTDRGDAAVWLDQVVQANLFITPLDDEGHWYRYHALFADALQHRLQHDRAGRVSQVYRCASDWHIQYGSIEEAIEYALRGGDVERAGDLLILPQAAPELLAQGKISTLHTWLSCLPAEVIRRRPGLGTTQAWLMAIAGQLNAIEPLLQQIEARLVEMGPAELSPDDRADFVGELAALRAGLALSNFEVPRAIELGEQALAHVPQDKRLVRGMILYTLAAAYRYQPNLEAAARTYLEAQSLSRALSHPLLALYSLDGLADVRETQGRLHEAAHLREEMLRSATRHDRPPLPIASTALVGLSKIYRAWNQLDIAGQHAEQALSLAQRNGLEGIVVDSLITSAVVQRAAGQIDVAHDRLRQAAELSQQINNVPLSLRISAYQAQLDLIQQHLDAALRWQQLCGVSVDDEVTELRLIEQVTIARVLIARGQAQRDRTAWLGVQKLLARLLHFTESSGEVGQAIEVLTLQAVTYQALGDKVSALDALERAVQFAEPEDHVRVFLDAGEIIKALLADLKVSIEKRSSAQRGRWSQFVVRLLEAFANPGTKLQVKSSPIQNLAEPLSERELEVLRLLAAGKKNQEIADALFVVLGTVKAHINRIYRKLEVSTRVQAVTRARELGLL